VFIAVIATLATSQFWLLMSELYHGAEAKRAFAKVSGGGLLALLGAAVVAAPGLVSVLLLRGTDGGLYSLHRSSIEVLYLPLARRVRARAGRRWSI
jgi:hypothetical protein